MSQVVAQIFLRPAPGSREGAPTELVGRATEPVSAYGVRGSPPGRAHSLVTGQPFREVFTEEMSFCAPVVTLIDEAHRVAKRSLRT